MAECGGCGSETNACPKCGGDACPKCGHSC